MLTDIFKGKGAHCLPFTLKWFKKKIYIHIYTHIERADNKAMR